MQYKQLRQRKSNKTEQATIYNIN